MPVDFKPIPAPGFVKVSGKRPPKDGEWFVQSRNGLVWEERAYAPDQLVWLHTGSDWDIVAVKRV